MGRRHFCGAAQEGTMANAAIISSWGANVAGREAMGLGVFMGAVQYFTERKAAGEIEDLRIYLAAQGNLSEVAGHMIVEGSAAQIAALTEREDYRTLIVKAVHIVHNFNSTTYHTGDEIMKRIEMLQAARKELGI
jgi:hypothetical protein